MAVIHVVSVSGGKDSTATLKLAVDRVGRENLIAIFCDTGNEDQTVYDYLAYLEELFGIRIVRLKAEFSEQIAQKRAFVAGDTRPGREYDTQPVFDSERRPVWARDGNGRLRFALKKNRGAPFCALIQKSVRVGGGRRVRWSNKAKRRALAVLHPTGNPFLDLCLWKGRFPSRKAQFCTEELKRNMAVAFQLDLIDTGHRVISWQGVRRDESRERSDAKKMERIGPAMWAFRPLVEWSAGDVFSYCADHRIKPNPLYLEGCDRVGCMPCINVSKDELRNTSQRREGHIARIAGWEIIVGQASKRGAATFLPAPGDTRTAVDRGNIWQRVEWSRTTRGGRQYDLLGDIDEPTTCASSYGLCA
ncbi:phosphoadenosine phosphosulfate reductase domain-containing protein [Chromobacterium haemolyticum]|uniref:Phosphoadenosine phosphosulfate reductase n=1 Tax=Chromobacterium haemolyticum TaxID=394935 RepID=A0A1W0D5M3_9NEIS|nr:phosphoadenosine phosphosulfate reductase family protein [Chromobacterium haemolyticum]OQS42286.1 phosphoadenosine phosphosulfate reductase [Chromobacterium haemolyticum]